VSDVPDEVRDLADRRERARRARDFAEADALRDLIRKAGFDVTDTPSGPILARREPEASVAASALFLRSGDVPSLLGHPPRYPASFQWVVQGWPEDVVRGILSVRRTTAAEVQQVVVDAAGLEGFEWPRGVEVVRVAQEAGWGVARNAGLRRSAGKVVMLLDGSVEATGDLTALRETLRDPSVGITGPFGIVSDDLHEFQGSEGPEVDAVEGYLMAFRRDLVVDGLRFDEKFKFYRTADIELSFQVKAMGLRATVTRVPVTRHEHRMWSGTPEAERARLSKRNFYRFLDRWRGRTDLLVSRGGPGSPGSRLNRGATRR
jgi:cysteinyl-tRNA synthetase